MELDKLMKQLFIRRRFAKHSTGRHHVKPAPESERVNNLSSDSEGEDDVKVSKERGGGKVARTSSAEKRRHSDSKHSLSSTSSSSDEELKELATPKSTKHKQSLRNSTFSRNFYDEEVFMEPSRSGGLPKRSKMTSIQPSSGRYTDFDKMRRTQGFQQGHITVRRHSRLGRREDFNHFHRMGPTPVYPMSLQASPYTFQPIVIGSPT